MKRKAVSQLLVAIILLGVASVVAASIYIIVPSYVHHYRLLAKEAGKSTIGIYTSAALTREPSFGNLVVLVKNFNTESVKVTVYVYCRDTSTDAVKKVFEGTVTTLPDDIYFSKLNYAPSTTEICYAVIDEENGVTYKIYES